MKRILTFEVKVAVSVNDPKLLEEQRVHLMDMRYDCNEEQPLVADGVKVALTDALDYAEEYLRGPTFDGIDILVTSVTRREG